MCVSLYRLVAELQQLVSQSVGISDEFLQRLFETDGFLKDLITAIHAHGVGRLQKIKINTQSGVQVRKYFGAKTSGSFSSSKYSVRDL